MFRVRFIAVFAGLMLPAVALAVPPPAVTGLSGVQQPNGEVRISWSASADASVVKYRLYYSAESILESGGIYDDFEETQGTETIYVFTDPPNTSTLYVTVLAVSASGEESEAFVEEVHVDLTQASSSEAPRLEPVSSVATEAASSSLSSTVLTLPASSSSSAVTQSSAADVPVRTDPAEDGRVHLLLTEALSPIQVKLTFSHPVTVEPTAAPQALRIEGPGGVVLRITQILISENLIIADTEAQGKGMVYNVKVSEPLMGIDGLPLDFTDRSAFFIGHPQGMEGATMSMPTQPAVYDPMHPQDVAGLRLRATPEAGGTYTVVAQWQPDLSRGDIAYYAVRQSLDGGKTFSEPQVVPMDIAGIEFKGVRPGEFGLALHVVNVYGGTSTGVFDSMSLPGAAPVVTAPIAPQAASSVRSLGPANTTGMVTGDYRQDEIRTKRLSKTGMGLFVFGSSMIGSYAGWRRGRKAGAWK